MERTMRWRRDLVALALMSQAVLACGGDDNGPSGPSPGISLTAAPAALTLQQGASGTVTVTLTRVGNFSGAVSAAVSGLPTGIVVSVTPISLTGTATTTTVTVDVAGNVATGTYTATVTGTATGVASATTTFTVTVTAAPNVALAVSPATLSVPAGGSGSTTVNITRTNFTGAVALTLDAPPAGIGGTFNPASATTNSSALTVTVAASVAPGPYTLTIKGSATGVGDRTTTLALTVTAPPGSIAVALAPTSASVVQGGSGQATVNITRTNFTGAVTLAATGAPAGVTVGFSQSPTTAASVQLTYSATLAAPVGTHTITVTASAGGVSNATATFTLQVTQAPPAGQVEFQFCSASENPLFFAYQDGTGAWQRVTGTQSSGVYRYTFSLTQTRGGVFYVQQSGTGGAGRLHGTLARTPWMRGILPDATARLGQARTTAAAAVDYETSVFYGATTELTAEGVDNCLGTQSTKTVSLAVAGVAAGQGATLSLGGSSEFFIGGVTTSPVQFTDVRNGTIDFIGARSDLLTGVPDKLMDVRNLNPADGSTLSFTADFNGANAYAPASAQVTVGNALGDDLLAFGAFSTSNGEVGLFGTGFDVPVTGQFSWFGVPTNRLQAGDLHASVLFASPASSTTNETRVHFLYSTQVQNLTQTLGPKLPTPAATSIGAPAYRRLRVTGALPTEYNDLVFAHFGPSGGGNEVTVVQTGAYLAAAGSAATYDLSIPDLTALAGFPLTSGLPAGEIEATVDVNGWTGSGTTAPAPVNGTVFQIASKTVKITVP